MQNEEYEVRLIKNVQELEILTKLFIRVFEIEHPSKPDGLYLKKLFRENHFFAVVAIVNHSIAGGLTAYLLPSYTSSKPMAYVHDLAVLTQFQRSGIGKKILNYTKMHCKNIGVEELFLHTHEDERTIRFYRNTQPSEEEKVRLFSYRLL